MSFGFRLCLVALAGYAVANVVASLALAALWRTRIGGRPSLGAASLLRLRAMPVVVATVVSLWGVVAFLLFEPRGQHETFGGTMLSLAGVAVALVASALWRVVQLARSVRRVNRAWLDGSQPLEIDGARMPAVAVSSPFPIVAVAGWFRPRLIVAQSVLSACAPDELGAILAHEAGHVARRDNLARLFLSALPDVFGWLPASRRLTARWHEAAEDAADDSAAAARPGGRLTLAAALIRVARLAPAEPMAQPLPVTALYRGGDVARRVRRLLDAPPAVPVAQRGGRLRRLAVVSCGVALGLTTTERLHDLVEALVTRLP
jgi:Zn-dependent protease with chaperone function